MELFVMGYYWNSRTMAELQHLKSYWIYISLLILAAVGAEARRNEESAPRITEHPSSLFVRKNSPATLHCRASGFPIPQITWLKDGQPLSEDGATHRNLLPGQLFFLRVIPKQDIGYYQCVATNTLGSAYSNNATLEIAYLRGDFRLEPEDTTALTGEAVVLECSPPRGHPTPEISWERNGETVVADETRIRLLPDGNLVISQPKSSDQGNYVCLATNSEGTKRSAPGRLTVHSRPTFTTTPEDSLHVPGEAITLACEADGEPQPTIRWVKRDGDLPEGRHTILKDNSLRIRNAQSEDSGTYVCTAHNTWGDATVTTTVTVSAAPMFTRQPVDRTVVVGQEAFFLCEAIGQPLPPVYWSKRGANQPVWFPGEHEGRFKVTTEGRLHIQSVTREDEGYYVCSAMSARGTIEDSTYLRVLDDSLSLPPIIQVGPSNQTLVEGAAAELVCQAEGSTQPSITWLKDGQPLSVVGSRITLEGSGTLKFSALSPDDAGIYTCSAANSVGATTWAASLQVIQRSFGDTTAIREAAGSLQLPQSPGFPIVDNITRSTMRLSWTSAVPLEDHIIPLSCYRVEYFTPDQMAGWMVAAECIQGNSFTVKNLEAGDTYVFLVRGINGHGYGMPSPVSLAASTVTSLTRRPNVDPAIDPPVATPPTDQNVRRDIIRIKLDNCGLSIKKAEAIGITAIKVTWQITQFGDYIEGYILRLRPRGTPESNFIIQKVVDSRTAVEVGLQPWTQYEVTVQPYHGLRHLGRESRPAYVRTGQDVPKAPPQNIKASQNGSTSIKVSWRPPVASQVPGIIVGYHVFCISENPPRHKNVTTNNRTESVNVVGLTPDQQYGVKVAAYTIAGMGPFSDIVYVTLPKGPEDPSNRDKYNKENEGGGGMASILTQPWFYAAAALALVVIFAFISALVWRRLRKKPCSPVNNVIIKDNGTVQSMASRPTHLNGYVHSEAETTLTSAGPPHSQHGCMGNCCTGNGSSGDDTLEKNKAPPSKWPNGAPPVWLQEVYNPKYPSHLQSQVSKETHLTHDSQSSSGFGSSFPTLSTFHGMMMHPSSPEYAVVENEAEMEEEMSMHAGGTLPIIPSPGSTHPPPQYTQRFAYQMTDDPEPYASATLVQQSGPGHRDCPARRQGCSDSSSEWSGSWQSNREGRRPGRMVKPGGHGSPRGWHGMHEGVPPIPDRDIAQYSGYSDHSSQYSRCSSASKRNWHPHATTPGRQPQRNWAEFLPPPPEQPPTDVDSPGSQPPSHPGSLKSSHMRRGSSPNQPMGNQAYVQINPGTCEDCEANRCPPVPPRHHQQSPLMQPLSGHNSPIPIMPPPLIPQNPCRTEIPGPQSHFQPITSSLSPPPGDSPSHKKPLHKVTRTPPPANAGSMTPVEFGGGKQTSIPLSKGPSSPTTRGVGQMRGGYDEQAAIATQRLFEDPRHAQIGQELLQYMSRNELEAMSDDAQYAPMEMELKHTDGPQSNAHQAMCDVETTELTHLNKDMETASNCTGSMLAYGSSNGSRRNSQVSTSSDGSFFTNEDFASAVAAAAQSSGVAFVQRQSPASHQHLLQEDTV